MTKRAPIAIAVLLLAACSDQGKPDVMAPRRREVLGALGMQVIVPTYMRFTASVAALEAATAAYAADLSPAHLTAAQDAWRSAMSIWEEAEVLQIGPEAKSGTIPGGRDMRDPIYAWPIVRTCHIDQEIVSGPIDDADAFAMEVIDARTLYAMEYLLFPMTDANTCSATADINAMGTWAALGTDGVHQRRATYAHTLAVLVQRAAMDLQNAWDPMHGNFLGELMRAGDGSTVYPHARDAMNSLANAMFYLEVEVKDMKLAEPLGLSMCATPTCPQLVESRFAHHSIEDIQANLRSFQRLFLGDPAPDGLGCDDLLRDMGANDLADRMIAALTAAIAAVDALAGATLEDALASNEASVMNAYATLQAFTMLLKTEFITVLDLDLPQRAPSDVD